MPEVRNVNVQQIDEKCSRCGRGYMRPTGIISGQPPQYEHVCNAGCGNRQNYQMRYPYTIG